MPTTKLKNTVYRLMLPFLAPGCGSNPVSSVSGHAIIQIRPFVHLLRKHHVLGSATLISDSNTQSIVCSFSDSPLHRALPDTFFRVASITKTATAILVMRFVDEGMLSLDQSVIDFFPFLKESSCLKEITLRHLLSHTSGIIDPPSLEQDLENGKPFCNVVPEAVKYRPGDSFHYSNLGFGLIGCVLESVLNKPLGTIFDEYLFHPLHMNATLEGCTIPKEKIMPVTRILPYRKGADLYLTALGKKPLTSPDPERHYGHTAGSMYTDVSSLQKLLLVLMGEDQHFLSASSVQEITNRHASYGKLSPSLSYGLGLLQIEDPSLSGSRILGHQGFAYGCADGAFWEEATGRMIITLNGGCSEARYGRLGAANRDFIRWAFRKELPSW